MSRETVQATAFVATLEVVGSTALLRLPTAASQRLPSRGQVAVRGRLNDSDFATVLEPDGVRGHWLRVDEQLQRAAGAAVGDPVDVTVDVVPDWPEPEVPTDLAAALRSAPAAIQAVWTEITPMARWEWVRWVYATANPVTRQRRVDVTIDKMANGKRRPCCFDLAACTDPAVSRSGKLLGPP